jgi:holo-[acyl-carrier protein] synthase
MFMSGITDEAEFDEFRKTLDWRGLAEKVTTPYLVVCGSEDQLCPRQYTDAFVKALGGPSGLSWQHMSVVRAPSGQPRLELTGAAADAVDRAGANRVHVSISHDGGYAVAVVILEGP